MQIFAHCLKRGTRIWQVIIVQSHWHAFFTNTWAHTWYIEILWITLRNRLFCLICSKHLGKTQLRGRISKEHYVQSVFPRIGKPTGIKSFWVLPAVLTRSKHGMTGKMILNDLSWSIFFRIVLPSVKSYSFVMCIWLYMDMNQVPSSSIQH